MMTDKEQFGRIVRVRTEYVDGSGYLARIWFVALDETIRGRWTPCLLTRERPRVISLTFWANSSPTTCARSA